MKKWLFLLPLAATAAAIAANLRGYIMGGPREGWELAVTAGYLAAWAVYLRAKPAGWQKIIARLWWMGTSLCAAAGFAVVTWNLDGFLLIFPAMGLITPLSGLAVLTRTNYPVFYGAAALIAVGYTQSAGRRHADQRG